MSVIMPRRRKLVLTTRRPYIHSAANVICVMVGSRYKRIPRSVLQHQDFDSYVVIWPLQNTRYVVVSGARQKEEDWDPEENGGFAVHG